METQPIKSKNDLQALKSIIWQDNYKFYVLISTQLNTGLRISDILKLKHSDFSGCEVHLTEQKTGKSKSIKISARLLDMVQSLRALYPNDIFLFSNRAGDKAWSRTYEYNRLLDYCRQANINPINIGTHSIRKTFGYFAYKSGVSLEVLQSIFNHSSSKVTLRYIGITQDTLNSVYTSLCL